MHAYRTLVATLLAVTMCLACSCGRRDAAAKARAIEAALKPLEEIQIPTGSRLNIAPAAVPMFRRLQAAELIRFADVPQGYWDNFATQTFMEGARPFRVLATQKLNDSALNPRWKAPSRTLDLSEETIVRTLEQSWNFYAQRELFLGITCFGGDVSVPNSDGACVHELNDRYPEYSALAKNGLIELADVNPNDLPPATVPYLPRNGVKHAARIALTPQGRRLATLDEKKGTATFVFGKYRVEKVTKNAPIAARAGVYRLVEGTHVLDLRPEFHNVWQQAGNPTYRERQFRSVFYYNETWPFNTATPQEVEALAKCRADPARASKCAPKWEVATASNRRYTAEDDGPRNGTFESSNVPQTVDELALQALGNNGDDSYTWRIRPAQLKVGDVLRDVDYKGLLATPGETFRLVLAKIDHHATDSPVAELATLLPGRLRCILKYSDFDKEWKVVALDVAPSDSEQWATENVR
jgi:hypothetical protein